MDKEKLKKVAAGTGGGVGIVTIFLMLHGDIKAEIKTALNKIEDTVSRVTVLETQELERDRRFIHSQDMMIKKMDRMENKIDKIMERVK